MGCRGVKIQGKNFFFQSHQFFLGGGTKSEKNLVPFIYSIAKLCGLRKKEHYERFLLLLQCLIFHHKSAFLESTPSQ